jgi:OOP family OmpA-OmpF porin
MKKLFPLITIGLMVGLVSTTACTRVFDLGAPITVTATPPPPPPEPEPEPEPEPKLVEVTQDAIVIHDKIQFDTGKATIKEESFALMGEIATVMKENPQIKKVSIEGHTDSVGSSRSNKKLSDDRAHSVMTWLTENGVDAARMAATGFGEDKPIGDNETDEGKAKNRRVEFIITEQEEVKKSVEVKEGELAAPMKATSAPAAEAGAAQ